MRGIAPEIISLRVAFPRERSTLDSMEIADSVVILKFGFPKVSGWEKRWRAFIQAGRSYLFFCTVKPRLFRTGI